MRIHGDAANPAKTIIPARIRKLIPSKLSAGHPTIEQRHIVGATLTDIVKIAIGMSANFKSESGYIGLGVKPELDDVPGTYFGVDSNATIILIWEARELIEDCTGKGTFKKQYYHDHAVELHEALSVFPRFEIPIPGKIIFG